MPKLQLYLQQKMKIFKHYDIDMKIETEKIFNKFNLNSNGSNFNLKMEKIW